MIENYFCVRHKNRRKYKQNFKLLFFKLNSHFGPSNEIYKYRKLNLFPINNIYLIVSYLEIQSTLHFFLLCLKRNGSQTVKSTSCEKFSSSAYVTNTTCFDECFLFHVMTGRHYFLYKFIFI